MQLANTAPDYGEMHLGERINVGRAHVNPTQHLGKRNTDDILPSGIEIETISSNEGETETGMLHLL